MIMNTQPRRISGAAIDPKELRSALGCFITGVVVVAATGEDGRRAGVTISSFNSVSLTPPLILWSLGLNAPSLAVFRTAKFFSVNILASDQQDICRQFATPADDKFRGVDIREGTGGVPVIPETAACFECATYARYPGGDHEIYLGEVLSFHTSDREPLIHYKGAFRNLSDV